MKTFVTRTLTHANTYRKEQRINWPLAITSLLFFCLMLGMAKAIVTDAHAAPLTFNPKLSGYLVSFHAPIDTNSHSKYPSDGVDLDKLSKAVACAETSCGKDGTAIHRNNHHGIMCWPNGKRTPCYFKTPGDSYVAFKKIWGNPSGNYKGRSPDTIVTIHGVRENLATLWTGNDHPDEWLHTVTLVYNRL